MKNWDDSRFSGQVYGQFVNSDGSLNGDEFMISQTDFAVSGMSQAAFDGSNFMIVWSGGASISAQTSYGRIVSTSGVFVTNEFQVSNNAVFPRIAFDGTNYLVTWTDLSVTPTRIVGAHFAKSGAYIAPSSGQPGYLFHSSAASDFTISGVVFGNSRYLVLGSSGVLLSKSFEDVIGVYSTTTP